MKNNLINRSSKLSKKKSNLLSSSSSSEDDAMDNDINLGEAETMAF